MQRALEFALSLTLPDDEAALTDWLLAVLHKHWQPQGALVGLPEFSGRQLECRGLIGSTPVALSLEADDFGHPLSYVMLKNQVRIWDTLYGGARIDNAAFRQLLMDVGAKHGLFALPIPDAAGKIVGVLGVFDEASRLWAWRNSGDLELLLQVYVRQLARVQSLRHNQRESTQLRASLRQIAGESEQRRLKTTLLESQLVGQSVPARQLREQIDQLAGHSLSVLIQGETGAGKEVVARLLHQCSARADRPFVAINCAAIPENLIESELFGYLKGAFSGAQGNKEGLVAQANGGTLFLDEVGDMPLPMQAKLLRVLETRSYRPLGSDKECHSDFRVLAATHQPLDAQVAEGCFRQDLFHRLCQSQILVPALRDRAEDISLLSNHFITVFGEREGKRFGTLRRSLLTLLLGYAFPGNVRELRNLLEVACAHTADGDDLGIEALPLELLSRLENDARVHDDDYNHIHDLRQAISDYEAAVIAARMRYYQGNRLRVAESLNIARRTLDHKCLKLEVQ
ncbi:sigma-54 interaction domain-containing protein [Siccibacter turicensis]|uniref:sigma-54 interaction domain-containing protein n=1 Tax=Siccibacter turicensis TaxID=357233 RepID=UPI0004678615|nr:sigma-54 dependent transcriptional regulator [Siccibacter turicensis]MDY0970720.1 sigma-54 dependent transcriptional regulator [Siccibacter turicensis]